MAEGDKERQGESGRTSRRWSGRVGGSGGGEATCPRVRDEGT